VHSRQFVAGWREKEAIIHASPRNDLLMVTQGDNPELAPRALSGTSRKLLQLVRKRVRQLLRVTSVLVISLALAATALAIWWMTSLNGLPDIEDPFDVNAIRGFTVADEENALTFLRRAQKRLIPFPVLPPTVHVAAPMVAWSEADPMLRTWVEANRHALELFQKGADRPDDIWKSSGQNYWHNYPMINTGGLIWVALMEGGRRGENGDMAGAWDCYRALLRLTTQTRVGSVCHSEILRIPRINVDTPPFKLPFEIQVLIPFRRYR
jgi:hypothetical protein